MSRWLLLDELGCHKRPVRHYTGKIHATGQRADIQNRDGFRDAARYDLLGVNVVNG